MGLWNFLVTSQMEPHDDFRQRLRKSVMGVLFLLGLAIVIYGVRGLTYSVAGEWAPDVAHVAILLEALIFIGGFLAMRKHRHASDTNVTSVLWLSVCLNSIMHVVFVQFDTKAAIFAQACLAVMMQINGMKGFFALLTVHTLVQDWNKAHLITRPEWMLTLPDPVDDAGSWVVLVGYFAGSITLTGCISMFHNQVVESERRGAAQQAANEMTMKVLQRHRKYDTEGVSKILEECTEASVVDPALIALFEGMNGNLESYRPFLPNYLFQQDDTSGEDEEGELDRSGVQTGGDASDGLTSKLDRSALSSSNFGGSQRSSRQHSARHDQSDSRSTYSHTADARTIVVGINKRGKLYEGRITFALVDICADRLDRELDRGNALPSNVVDPDNHHVALTSLVTQLYAIAKETKASVHSMLGDTVQLTWNATNNVALPETKGVQFLSRLVAAFSDSSDNHPTLGIRGAVNSGRAAVHNITANHQQALLIDAPWLPALEGSFHLAKRGSGSLILMDERTMKGSHLEVTSCAVEQVFTTPPDAEDAGSAFTFLCHEPRCGSTTSVAMGTTTMVLYQILGEKVRTDNEWMYELQQDGDEGSAKNSRALSQKNAIAAIVEGQFKEALALLEASIPDEQSGQTESFRLALIQLCKKKSR